MLPRAADLAVVAWARAGPVPRAPLRPRPSRTPPNRAGARLFGPRRLERGAATTRAGAATGRGPPALASPWTERRAALSATTRRRAAPAYARGASHREGGDFASLAPASVPAIAVDPGVRSVTPPPGWAKRPPAAWVTGGAGPTAGPPPQRHPGAEIPSVAAGGDPADERALARRRCCACGPVSGRGRPTVALRPNARCGAIAPAPRALVRARQTPREVPGAARAPRRPTLLPGRAGRRGPDRIAARWAAAARRGVLQVSAHRRMRSRAHAGDAGSPSRPISKKRQRFPTAARPGYRA